ncbi:PREDICTED: protein WVD2-like 2 [Ipomoea nil]|uniref:protein WVD2-like 2 n=1 Tax=Ipomoea nil TaxID=35883 RepID=UPI00090194AC|nr:PREDICTED: protein WVD2-like 2 [Ipomoea nil]
MGRDVTGNRTSNKPAVVNFIPNNAVNVSNNISLERVETKDTKAEDHGEKQDVLSVKSMNRNTDMMNEEEKAVKGKSTLKSSHNKLSLPMNDKNPIVSKPSDLGTEDHAIPETVDAGSSHSANPNDLETPNKPLENSPEVSIKSQQQQLDDRKDHEEEEDSCSLVSSSGGSSVRGTKFKVTIPLGPTFRSEERAARRKEFHMKMEEKHKALEAEKQEQAARAKEMEEAAIRQLRKSMVYKANPVPNFYREGPPPKAEVKKLPVTRAKLPNLARRKSCSDVFISYPEEKKGCAKARHSIGSYTEESSIIVKGRPKSVKEAMEMKESFAVEEIQEENLVEVEEEMMMESSLVKEMKEENPVEVEEEMMKESSPVKEMKQNSAE